MTKEQRLERYCEAYEKLECGEWLFICLAMDISLGPFEMEKKFPELYAMSPSDEKLEFGGVWVNVSDKETRLVILAFCIAMCQV